jgi:branched-chain amino acid transport system permease protein
MDAAALNPANLVIQVFNGLVTGSFYALLSLGLAIIFGMLRVINFAHGAFYMLGAFGAYILLQQAGIGFWPALVLVPLAIGLVAMVLERTLICRLYTVDPLYNFLLTFGVALVLQDAMRLRFGVQGQPYAMPRELAGAVDLGVASYPLYRLFVIAFALLMCVAVWFLVERTRLGMVIRAATEKPDLTRALGVNVDRWVTPVFGFGVALAALGGVLAAPMRNVSPLMGAELIIAIFAVVVIGGMGSILGAVVAGFIVGVLGALGAVFYPPLANTLLFILMAVVLLVRPAGLFGSAEAG